MGEIFLQKEVEYPWISVKIYNKDAVCAQMSAETQT
jgi:hypothetical protein